MRGSGTGMAQMPTLVHEDLGGDTQTIDPGGHGGQCNGFGSGIQHKDCFRPLNKLIHACEDVMVPPQGGKGPTTSMWTMLKRVSGGRNCDGRGTKNLASLTGNTGQHPMTSICIHTGPNVARYDQLERSSYIRQPRLCSWLRSE